MEAQASSPRADRSWSVKDQRNKEKSNCQPNTNRPNSFHVLKSDCVPVTARARLLIIAPLAAAEPAPVSIVVVAAILLSTANRLTARYTGNTELPRNCCNLL